MKYLGRGFWHYFKSRVSQYPIVAISLTIVLTFILFIPLGVNAWNAHRRFNHDIVNGLYLQQLVGQITYLDEVLTMSARMNAVTGDTDWEDRYKKFEPQLNEAIQAAIKLDPEAYASQGATVTNVANLKLVEMEHESFQLVQQGQRAAAVALLSGENYEVQKKIYADGMQKSNSKIQTRIYQDKETFSQTLLFSSIISGISLLVLLPMWGVILQLLRQYLRDVKNTRHSLQLLNAELELRVENRTFELTEALSNMQQMHLKVFQNEKMSALGKMVAGVAHEINNPNNFVHGNIHHLEKYTQDLLKLIQSYQSELPQVSSQLQNDLELVDIEFIQQDFPKLISSMRSGTKRIRAIVQSLRNFSHLDEAALKTVNLVECIDSTLVILESRLKQMGKRLEIIVVKEYSENLPMIECYVGELNQVFFNLIDNAIDAIEIKDDRSYPNKNVISIAIEPIQQEWMSICISDSGIGISDEIRSRVFDPFFTTKPIGHGTGLGLSITYQIITEQHHGQLWCESTPAKGSKFHIKIPIKQSKKFE